MTRTSKYAAALLLATCAVPAFAQNAPDRIVLESKAGSVMTSTGGAYESAEIGKRLASGESMMLNDGATASVVYYYDNGNRKCVENYSGPNTYVIDDSCATAAAFVGSTSPGKSALVIVGAGLIAAALIESAGDVPVGPISSGPNGTLNIN